MDQPYERSRVHRYVVIVDRRGNVVAREDQADKAFAPYTDGELPQEVRSIITSPARSGTRHMLSGNVLMHVVPFKGTGGRLRAVVFEEVRVRAANQ